MAPNWICPFSGKVCPAADSSIREEHDCPLRINARCAIRVIADEIQQGKLSQTGNHE
ncbi:hypothetical protein ES705_08877 [subsurface metagenome]